MKKFFVLFRVPVASMDRWMKDVSDEERKKQSGDMMKAWGEWAEKHKAEIVDNGAPLGKTKTVSKNGIADSRNDLNYYIIVEAASHDEAAKLLSDNPHVTMIPDATADVMEIPQMGK